MEKSEEQLEREFRIIDEMFTNAQFTPSIDLEDLDNIVTDKKEITIQQTFTCYCYDDMDKPPKYFTIKCGENQSLTNKYIINELIKKGLTIDCNHRFLEGFYQLHDNMYEMWTGS